MSVARLLAQVNNSVPAASVLASSIKAALYTVYRQQTQRVGNGQVIVSGGYTGANDATFEIEIRPANGTAARVSKPLFAGAGNGPITQPTAANGTVSQAITATLVDLGTDTTIATAILYGDIQLRAKASGHAGNSLRLTVAPALTITGTQGALSFALNKDTQEWTDQRHDFGAVALNPDGTLPSTAPRLTFAGDQSRVYRHYKRWDGTQWQYGVSPKLAADYAPQSIVQTVGGTYTIAVTDGVATESYPGLTTLYSLLNALSASELVEVVGIAANDAKPNGMAAVDIPFRTVAFALPVIKSDPKRLPNLIGVSVSSNAPTETVTVRCVQNTPVGGESWSVVSQSSGALPNAQTGVDYDASPYVQFKIPIIPLDSEPMSGRMAITDQRYQKKDGIPAICLYRPQLGAKASTRTLTLVWTPRPQSDCNCMDASVTGGPNSACLGLNVTGEEGAMLMPAWQQSRLETLMLWREGFLKANAQIAANGELRAAQADIELAETISALFVECMDTLLKNYPDTEPPAAALTAWGAALTALDTELTPLEALGSPAEPLFKSASAVCAVGDVVQITAQTGLGTTESPVVHLGMTYGVCIAAGEAWAVPYTSILPEEGAQIGGGTSQLFRIISRAEAYALAGGNAGDINSTTPATPDPGIARDVATFVKKYAGILDVVLIKAFIRPKSEASSNGSACWQDPGDDHYWLISGTSYQPVFNNVYYHSCVKNGDVIESTHEFGFGLRVSCDERLTDGDTITISINDVSANYPYQINDTFEIPIVAGGPLTFAGGRTGTDTLTWKIESSLGALPDYALTAAEMAYNQSGVSFAIRRGGLAFALGDQFKFNVTAGSRYRWRKDSGAWSSDLTMADTVALSDGLSAAFVAGATPDFVVGDVHRFVVRQPYSPDHVQSAHGEHWQWSGSTATLTLTWSTDQTISAVGLLRHGLSTPASVTIELWDAAHATLATVTPTLRPGPLVMPLLATLATVRGLTISISNATGMALGWVYAGVPFETQHNHSRCKLQRAYALEKSDGINPRSTYLGAGRGGEIGWDDFLTQSDLDGLLSIIDGCKTDHDAPIVLLPNRYAPDTAMLARIDSNAIDISDWMEWSADDVGRRYLSVTLPLAPVLS